MEIREITPADLVTRQRANKWVEQFPNLYDLPLGKVIKCSSSSEFNSLSNFIRKEYPTVNMTCRSKKFEIVLRRELKEI